MATWESLMEYRRHPTPKRQQSSSGCRDANDGAQVWLRPAWSIPFWLPVDPSSHSVPSRCQRRPVQPAWGLGIAPLSAISLLGSISETWSPHLIKASLRRTRREKQFPSVNGYTFLGLPGFLDRSAPCSPSGINPYPGTAIVIWAALKLLSLSEHPGGTQDHLLHTKTTSYPGNPPRL